MPRTTPHTAATITAISDGYRAARVVFLRDGMVDADEMQVLRSIRAAQATALRADWSRRARQSVENDGEINPRLEREYREIEQEYPLEVS